MVLYRKVFPLGKGVSFVHYINSLEKANFPNCAFVIEKIEDREHYRAEVVWTASLFQRRGPRSFFFGGILLSECEIFYSKGERNFTLQASPSLGNQIMISLFIFIAALFWGIALYSFFADSGIYHNQSLLIVGVMALFLFEPTSVYLQDRKLLGKIGSIAMQIENP